MKTRKILTMGYAAHTGATKLNGEACDGDCYAYDDALRARDAGWSMAELTAACGALLTVHGAICGNPALRVGISLDESRGIWIGSFAHYGSVELVTASSLTECVGEIARVSRAYFASDQSRADLAASPGRGRGACAYGEDAALIGFMTRASGVPEGERATIEAAILAEAQRAAAIWDAAAIHA